MGLEDCVIDVSRLGLHTRCMLAWVSRRRTVGIEMSFELEMNIDFSGIFSSLLG